MRGVRFVSGRYSRGSGAAKDTKAPTEYSQAGANVKASRLGTPKQYGNKTDAYQGERYIHRGRQKGRLA